MVRAEKKNSMTSQVTRANFVIGGYKRYQVLAKDRHKFELFPSLYEYTIRDISCKLYVLHSVYIYIYIIYVVTVMCTLSCELQHLERCQPTPDLT